MPRSTRYSTRSRSPSHRPQPLSLRRSVGPFACWPSAAARHRLALAACLVASAAALGCSKGSEQPHVRVAPGAGAKRAAGAKAEAPGAQTAKPGAGAAAALDKGPAGGAPGSAAKAPGPQKGGAGVTAAPKPVAQKPAPAKREDSVALHFSLVGSDDFALPEQGKAARMRVTPVDGKGQPITSLEPVAGSPLLVIAARTDLTWLEARAPVKLDEPKAATHTFTFTYKQAGPHVLLTLYKPKGAPLVQMPSYLTVKGPRKPDTPPGGSQFTWRGPKGLKARLVGDAVFDTCKPGRLGVSFKRKGKALKLEPLTPDGDRVAYLLVSPGARDVQIIPPSADTRLKGLPEGTGALLTTHLPGSFALLAVARVKGAPVIARFDIVVGGDAQPGGCSPASEPRNAAAAPKVVPPPAAAPAPKAPPAEGSTSP